MDIRICDLSKSYKNIRALDAINLTIEPGVHGLLGPNGAGKTTLMRILATILPADQGHIAWGTEFDWSDTMQIKGRIGYLPQQFGMYRYLKVREALENVALLKDIPPHHAKNQIQIALERTNLAQYSDRRVGQLSGGMLRRLGIAQAILGEPDLLILDEPSVGLDPTERINLRKLIREYDNGERIILLSSHIVGDIESLCEFATIVNKGRIVCSGPLSEIRNIARNRVIEENVSEIVFRSIEESHSVINFAVLDTGYKVRYLAHNGDGGAFVPPTLEDSYTYIIQEGGAYETMDKGTLI